VRSQLPESDSVNNSYSVGSYLRQSRESQGIGLDDAARVTRIGKNYLSALEDDRYDILPNPVYAKGFLRVYANFLGLSGDRVVSMFERSAFPSVQEAPGQKSDMRHAGKGGFPRGSGQRRWVIPVLLLALIIAAAYLFRDKEAAKLNVHETNPVSPPAVAKPAPVQQIRTSAAREPFQEAGREGKGKAEPIPVGSELQTGGIVLKIKINQDSSLYVTIDGMISQQYDLKAGDLIEWKADKVITLEVGNAGGIEAEFNGKPLKPFGQPGKSAHVVLKADGSSP
jgi:cytoskeletal protein RodZ